VAVLNDLVMIIGIQRRLDQGQPLDEAIASGALERLRSPASCSGRSS